MLRKLLTIGIILLFVGIAFAPVMAQNTEKPLPVSRGTWLYVGGSGPGNYSRIQDAINDASDGDTVFVYDDSSPYQENITINKSITLLGENRDTTVLVGLNSTLVIEITAVSVCVSGFTIEQFNNDSWTYPLAILTYADSTQIVSNRFFPHHLPGHHIFYCGILSQGANNLAIIDNVFNVTIKAIQIRNSRASVIKNNTIIGGDYNIYLMDCYDTILANNHCNRTRESIVVEGGSHNNINNNTINLGITSGQWWNRRYIDVSNYYGIHLSETTDIILTDNLINDCLAGICSELVNSSYIARNKITECFYGLTNLGTRKKCTFIDNDFHQNCNTQLDIQCFQNRYIHNYWGRPRLLPKLIFNIYLIPTGTGYYAGFFPIPILKLDLRPALLPNIKE